MGFHRFRSETAGFSTGNLRPGESAPETANMRTPVTRREDGALAARKQKKRRDAE